ncbi:glutamate--tRNA ligase [uncultured Algimonas sp.]|uniref:glutamate--tRNA ligase n=1 Tax=uncultured Algimonas sp. TaxID=1547920 RepID=UPI0026055D0F|nr:glutamate--tRNA ligase [uncultured Algimonas sp.]
MSRSVRTRFAPSPTGFLHIGGARTALFNRYFADRMGGEMWLRIEDTDKQRSTPDATQAIIDGLDWLGIRHTGDIVHQSRNARAHVAAAEALLASGAAYRCYLSAEDLDAERDRAKAAGTAFRSPYRDGETGSGDFAVRFRVPSGRTEIRDHVQGDVAWDNDQFDDLVLLRADGTPTYMLAVVVDDHDMQISHVIRGDDHLINAGRQQQLYDALGWDVPDWAHVPLIHGPDGKKLSKRHGALGVEAYREMGYLASGLRNYLVKLGWSDGDREIYLDDREIAEAFNLDGINAAPARLDFDKMDHVNAQHIAAADDAVLMQAARPFLERKSGSDLSADVTARIRSALPTLKPRSKTLVELADNAAYLFDARPLQITGKAAKPLRREGTADLVRALTTRLESLEDASWTADRLQSVLTGFVADHEIGFGKIGAPVRAALTAGAPSPDLHDVMALLGRDETLGRIEDARPAMG